MAKNFYLKSFIIAGLRRLTYKYPARQEALKDARVERGLYRCCSCKEVKKKKLIQLDHIEPVVGMEGFIDWNTYISRLFCSKEGFQAICTDCHDIKTNLEDSIRSLKKKKGK